MTRKINNSGRVLLLFRRGCCFTALSAVLALSSAYGGNSNLSISVDAARFQDAREESYLEIYYSLVDQTPYGNNGSTRKGLSVIMNMLVFKQNSLWATKVWKVERTYKDSLDYMQNREVVDMFRYFIDVPSIYRVVINARELEQEGNIDSSEVSIDCRPFTHDEVCVSDVQLATEIKRVTKDTPQVFAKKQYAVFPNPRQLFGEGVPNLYYYFESYNLSENVPGDKYKRLTYLIDSNGERLENLGLSERTVKKRHDMNVEMGMISVANVPTGQYSFVYGIADSTGNTLKTKMKAVFLYNPAIMVTSPVADGSLTAATGQLMANLNALDDEQLDEEFDFMRYIVKQEERTFYKNLDNPIAKRQFIAAIWENQANEQGLLAFEYRQTYLERLNIAIQRFSSAGSKGWKTDQGRVFILYGPVTEIRRFPSSNNNKPYEIWLYDSLQGQGGVEFIFVDRFGFRRYELVHSTLRGELRDPDWQRFIAVN